MVCFDMLSSGVHSELSYYKHRLIYIIDLWLQCYTQEEIAKQLDVTKGWINQFLNGYDKDEKHYDGYIEKFRNGKIAESKLLADFQ